jgi:hypothetical protein
MEPIEAIGIFFLVNDRIPSFLTIIRNICLTTVKHLTDRKSATIQAAYKEVHHLYRNRGFRITTVAMDGKFAPIVQAFFWGNWGPLLL